ILPKPESRRAPEKAALAEQRPAVPPPIPTAPPPIEAHGYARHGPGPMAAIRFKWTVRLETGNYYVDDTIGATSTPVQGAGPPRKRQLPCRRDHRREFRPDRLRPDVAGGRYPDGRCSRKRRTPALRAIEARDERTRRRRQSGPQERRRGITSKRFAGPLSR